MPSASLTFGDKFFIRILSGIMFAISSIWHGHRQIRSAGISSFPLGFVLFCKYARPFASKKTRRKKLEERKKYHKEQTAKPDDAPGDPLEDAALTRNCLLWSTVQLLCVVSGVFDWYPDVIIKGAIVLYILLTVYDSIETRPEMLRKEEMRRKQKEKLQLESAQFWRFLMPKTLWRWLGFENIVRKATTPEPLKTSNATATKTGNDKKIDGDSNDDDDLKKKQQQNKKELLEKVHIAKKVFRDTRETAVDDLIWGAIQIAYVVFDLTHKQAIGAAFMVYLCTLLEDVLVISTSEDEQQKKKTSWFKILWVSSCLCVSGKCFFS